MAVVEQDGAQHRSLGLEVVRRDGGLLERGHAPRRAVVMGRRVIMGAGRRWSWAQARRRSWASGEIRGATGVCAGPVPASSEEFVRSVGRLLEAALESDGRGHQAATTMVLTVAVTSSA